ncbi:hypothetical protein M9434_006464 [Picochlorum sp. BPE23]|nr:hypothetical protein M9434_006464 [Picochlorum sp. BPE23]
MHDMRESDSQEASAKRQRKDRGDPDFHDGADGIDHQEDAEESLMEIGLNSFLSECQVEHTESLDACLSRCTDALFAIPEGVVDDKPVRKMLEEFNFQGMKNPFVFKSPLQVRYIWGSSIGALSSFSPVAQIALEIPSECFDEKDHLNHRYYAKRILYLSHILVVLKKMKKDVGISNARWSKTCIDMRKPCLELSLKEYEGLRVEISTAIPVETFPLHKVAPERNTLRSATCTVEGRHELCSTPVYNRGIVEDMLVLHAASELTSLAKQFPRMRDVMVLLMAWASQHALLEGYDGLREEFLLEVLKMVLSEDQIYTVQWMHLFRGALLVLANETRFSKKGVFVETRPVPGIVSAAPSHQAWRKSGDPIILIDSTGWRNAGQRISAEVLHQASDCAKSTLKTLQEAPGPDAIDTIFMKKTNPLLVFDMWCKCTVEMPTSRRFESDHGTRRDVENSVKNVAARGLGDRATLVRLVHSPYITRSNAKGHLVSISHESSDVILGLRLDALKASRAVDVGPPADNATAAKEFRLFWGDKSELRRFQDGKICESVIWSTDESNKDAVVRQILDYILKSKSPVVHVDIPAMSLHESLIRSTISANKEILAERACIEGATKLGKMLKSLDDMTLGVVNTQPVSAVLRNTAIYPPFPHELAGGHSIQESDLIPRCLSAIDVFCQLEGSGKWPDAPAAYSKMKAALGVQLAQSLKSTYGIDAHASEKFVDVLFEGFAYRIILFSERDVAAVQKKAKSVGWSVISPEENIPLRQDHQGLISSLVAAHPSFKNCCRLSKLWVNRQCLGNHIREEAVELVCAAAYTTHVDIGTQCPASSSAGFMAFLDIIANHPWDVQPLLLDRSIAEEAGRLMIRLRAVGRAPAMFIVTGKRNEGDTVNCVGWTQDKPSKAVMFRARALAKKAIKIMHRYILGSARDGSTHSLPEMVFSHPMKDYEVLIRLRKDALDNMVNQNRFAAESESGERVSIKATLLPEESKYCRAVLSGIPRTLIENKGAKAIRKDLLIGFNATEIFATLLEEKYGPVAITCVDILGGNTIGLKIKPKFLAPHEYNPDYSCPIFDPMDIGQNKVAINFEAFAQDILSVGAGFVDSVDIQTQ